VHKLGFFGNLCYNLRAGDLYYGLYNRTNKGIENFLMEYFLYEVIFIFEEAEAPPEFIERIAFVYYF